MKQKHNSEAVSMEPQLADELIAYIPSGIIPQDISRGEQLVLATQYICTENQRLRRTLTQREQQVKELATERLLWGAGFNDEDTEEYAEKYGLPLEGSVFFELLVRLPGLDGPEHSRDIVRSRLMIREFFDSSLTGFCGLTHAVVRNDEFVLVSANGQEADAMSVLTRIKNVCAKALGHIAENCGRPPIICIGPAARDAETIRSSFKAVMDMREYSMSLGDEARVITMEDFPNFKPFDPDDRPFMAMAVEKQYINSVIAHDFGLACQLTNDKMEEMLQDSINGRKSLKPFLESRLEATADLLMVSLSAMVSGGDSVQDDLDAIKETADLDVIYRRVDAAFEKMDMCFNHSDSEVGGTAGKVIKYIAANYHNPSLSVEIICDEMGKSRSYLSRMFKENTGMNLLDYLHTTRITEAKRLLTETGLSVAEIGEKVGYYSGWTLARVFKRYEGITPSAYREAYRRGDIPGDSE